MINAAVLETCATALWKQRRNRFAELGCRDIGEWRKQRDDCKDSVRAEAVAVIDAFTSCPAA